MCYIKYILINQLLCLFYLLYLSILNFYLFMVILFNKKVLSVKMILFIYTIGNNVKKKYGLK